MNVARSWARDRMSLALWLPEVFRELRFWTSASSGCPWGALAFVGLLLICICWTFGFFTATLIFSHHCRRVVLHLARALCAALEPRVGALDLRGRLAQYQQ